MFRTKVIYVEISSLYEQVFIYALQNSMEQSTCEGTRHLPRDSSLSSAYETRRFFITSRRDYQWTSTWVSTIQPTLSSPFLSQYNQTRFSLLDSGKSVRLIFKITDFCHGMPCSLIEIYWGSRKYTVCICPEAGSATLPFSGTQVKFC